MSLRRRSHCPGKRVLALAGSFGNNVPLQLVLFCRSSHCAHSGDQSHTNFWLEMRTLTTTLGPTLRLVNLSSHSISLFIKPHSPSRHRSPIVKIFCTRCIVSRSCVATLVCHSHAFRRFSTMPLPYPGLPKIGTLQTAALGTLAISCTSRCAADPGMR